MSMGMCILSACMSVHHVCSACGELKPLDALELKMQMAVTCRAGSRDHTGYPGEQPALQTGPSELEKSNAWCFQAWLLILNVSAFQRGSTLFWNECPVCCPSG